ncbi:MAG: chemotaxis protein CheB [Mucilaginibacter sp.]|uniref:chemotaxis protein CheB n=1 Tax=Mucilaginibacter sp. TaxID=1882438 RepID=UPI0034E50C27
MAQIDEKQYIIAIGASAGGLEAISAFFDYTPMDGVSYILIQHLSPDFKSHLAQILRPHSKLQVVEVTDLMKVEANKVYLIPNTKYMVINNGELLLSNKKDKQAPHLTIDYFFISLAEERQDKAIGIILSGTGKDGSKGVEAIKKAGGIVMVQDPDTASFDGMPQAAIATNCADRVISPQAMPQVIEKYVKDGVLEILIDDKDDEISDEGLKEILSLIKGNSPLDFTDYKRPTILRRIKKRMLEHNFDSVDNYYAYLKNNPKEIGLLADDFLISVTSFFRDAEAFKVIENQVLPDIIDRKKNGDVLKIWVAGCATGEEAYSIAILVNEYLNKIDKEIEVKLFTTDLNKAALDVASKGIYTNKIENTVSAERLHKFFTPEGKNYKIKHEIRKMIIFAEHDLVKNPPYCDTDLISCRNLLIYMNPVLQKKVLSMMYFGLKKGGYLFLGPTESTAILNEGFTEISGKWNILKSNKNSSTLRFDNFLSAPVIERIKTNTMQVSTKDEAPFSKLVVADEINMAILEESGYCVCTDENLNVIRSFGDPSAYLKNEIFNLNLTSLLPDDISIAFKSAAYKALKLNQKVILKRLRFGGTDMAKFHLADIVIKPFFINQADTQSLLILFKENTSKATGINIADQAALNKITREHIESLETELAEAKHQLEVANDRIASSNENIQSFNEEMLSANEEMQSANEELQSINEELHSVNAELQNINREHQLANDELTELNDDLNNYFRSNINGQLFVDDNLLLKKYSPGTVKHINLRESDIGRPLNDITTNIKFETLIEDIEKVIQNKEAVTREVESIDGRIYEVMTLPYIRKNSNTANGAIVSFYDITEFKKLLYDLDISNKQLDISNKSLTRINADMNNFVYGASHDLNAPILNIEMVLGFLNKKMDLKDPEVLNLSNMVNRAVSNFKDVVKDLGKVGQMEAEMQEGYSLENFESVFLSIEGLISEKIKDTDTVFSTDFLAKEVRFSKKYLTSIMLNLITNAIKFRSQERQVKIIIKTEQVDQFILLTVTDNGIGINKDRLDFIFKMYHRVNTEVEGQGIGLYLIRKIINAADGKVEVESEVGKGSCFKVFFKV